MPSKQANGDNMKQGIAPDSFWKAREAAKARGTVTIAKEEYVHLLAYNNLLIGALEEAHEPEKHDSEGCGVCKLIEGAKS